MAISAIINIFLHARGWVAVAFLGFLLWAVGASISNSGVVTAGQWAVGIGVLMTILLILIRKTL
jgi:hypothetical protein